jgi:hypothetical protein
MSNVKDFPELAAEGEPRSERVSGSMVNCQII